MRNRRRTVAAGLGALLLAPVVGWGAYAAVTWLRFGRPQPDVGSDPPMQRYMPRHDIAEVHRRRVAAASSVAYDALLDIDLHRSRVVHVIFRGREVMLGATPAPRPANLPLVTELRSLGWGVLEEVPGRRLVLGAVTQPWRPDVVFRALPPETFASFDSAGYVKIVVSFAVDPVRPTESELRTETRALATDAASREKFRRYWSVFSPGILLIRSEALSLWRREAEQRQGADARRGSGDVR